MTFARRRTINAVAVAGVIAGVVAGATPASAEQIATWDISGQPNCNMKGEVRLSSAQVGDTFVIVGGGQLGGLGCLVYWPQHVSIDNSSTDLVVTFTEPYSVPDRHFNVNALFEIGGGSSTTTYVWATITPAPVVPESPAVLPPAKYTVNFVPGDGATCSVESVSGAESSWQRLPKTSACTKPGSTFVAWEARSTDGHPIKRFRPYSYINMTGDNSLFAIWADAPAAAAKATRWVIWEWDAKTDQMRPVTADLVDAKPVVTIHAKSSGAVSPKMVTAAKELASTNGGSYAGIVTSTKWTTPRIVTAYTR